MEHTGGLPGRMAVDHVGYTVPDLDKALDLFVNIFGCRLIFQGGPYDDAGYIWPGETEPAKTPMPMVMRLILNFSNMIMLHKRVWFRHAPVNGEDVTSVFMWKTSKRLRKS
jgi:hypothetical protein